MKKLFKGFGLKVLLLVFVSLFSFFGVVHAGVGTPGGSSAELQTNDGSGGFSSIPVKGTIDQTGNSVLTPESVKGPSKLTFDLSAGNVNGNVTFSDLGFNGSSPIVTVEGKKSSAYLSLQADQGAGAAAALKLYNAFTGQTWYSGLGAYTGNSNYEIADGSSWAPGGVVLNPYGVVFNVDNTDNINMYPKTATNIYTSQPQGLNIFASDPSKDASLFISNQSSNQGPELALANNSGSFNDFSVPGDAVLRNHNGSMIIAARAKGNVLITTDPAINADTKVAEASGLDSSFQIFHALKDASANAGSSGNILTSTGSATAWNSTASMHISTVTTGTTIPKTIPTAIGDIYVNTLGAKVYISKGISSSSDWVVLN